MLKVLGWFVLRRYYRKLSVLMVCTFRDEEGQGVKLGLGQVRCWRDFGPNVWFRIKPIASCG